MKKLILSAVVAAGAMFGAYTANQTNNEVDLAVSDLQIEDVEALAWGDVQDFLVQYAGYLNYTYTGQAPSDVVLCSGENGTYYLYAMGGGPNYKQCTVMENCTYSYTANFGVVQTTANSGSNYKTVEKCGYGLGGCVNKTCLD